MLFPEPLIHPGQSKVRTIARLLTSEDSCGNYLVKEVHIDNKFHK